MTVEVTVDAFLGGRVEAVQPKRGHHRSGLEAVLLAASVDASQRGIVADLGAGAGVAGLCTAARAGEAGVLLIEREPELVAAARQALARPANAAFAARVSMVETDIADRAALLPFAGRVGTVIANPPFNLADATSASPNPGRARAHVLAPADLALWTGTAERLLVPGGRATFIFRADGLARLLAAFTAFGAVDVLPIHPRTAEPAHRVIVTGLKGSATPARILPGLILHGDSGNAFRSEIDDDPAWHERPLPMSSALGRRLTERHFRSGPNRRRREIMVNVLSRLFGRKPPVVPLVRLSGGIGMGGALRSGLSLASVEKQLARAFAMKGAPAVAILVNSPGGSAVQSHLIYKRIRALAAERNKRVIVGVEDVAASGGYMLALAGDEIVVDAASIVGSIGVVFSGFGFQKLIEKLGIERRVHTAGESKAMLDPFQPEKPEDVARLEDLQREVHEGFIGLVKSRRPRLADAPELFTGAFWSGARAVSLGLVDRVGDIREVLRERYGDTVVLKPVAVERGFLRRRLGLSGGETAGFALAESVVAAVEERLLWGRYGL